MDDASVRVAAHAAAAITNFCQELVEESASKKQVIRPVRARPQHGLYSNKMALITSDCVPAGHRPVRAGLARQAARSDAEPPEDQHRLRHRGSGIHCNDRRGRVRLLLRPLHAVLEADCQQCTRTDGHDPGQGNRVHQSNRNRGGERAVRRRRERGDGAHGVHSRGARRPPSRVHHESMAAAVPVPGPGLRAVP